MGYGGKWQERERARELRAQSWTMPDIAAELGVSRSSVSLWTRDVEFVPNPRRRSTRTGHTNKLHLRKLAEIERCRSEGTETIGRLSDREFLLLGLALYAGEGSKTDGDVLFANSDPRMIWLFVTWLRRFFEVDETRMRLRLYLHEGLDLDQAVRFWSELTDIPVEQFAKPYRAPADPSIRRGKHIMGCPGVGYRSTAVHRRVMGMVAALLSRQAIPG